MSGNAKTRRLDPDGEFRLEQARKLVGLDRSRVDEVVRKVLDGTDGLPPITGPRRQHDYHLIRLKLHGHISWELHLKSLETLSPETA